MILKNILMVLGSMLLMHCVFETYSGGGVETNTLEGVALYPDGRPAAGARVRLRSEAYLQSPPKSFLSKRGAFAMDTLTDASGRFKVGNPGGGRGLLEINDGNSWAAALVCDSSESRGSTSLGTTILQRTGSISGMVFDSKDEGRGGYIQVYGLDRVAAVNAATGAFRVEDMPAGAFALRITVSGETPRRLDGITVAPNTDRAIGPVLLGWSGSGNLRVNTTSSGAGVASPLPDFPILVRFNKDNFDFARARSGGQDLRFYLPSGKFLPHEVARWDSSAGTAEAWVRLDTLAGNTVSSLGIAWGNPRAPDNSDGKAVFDPGTGAKAVFHFDAASGLSEASGSLAAGTNSGAALATGVAGNGFRFGSPFDNVVLFPPTTALNAKNLLENPQGCAFSWWMYPEEDLDSAVGRRNIIAKGLNWNGSQDQDWALWIESGRMVLEGRPQEITESQWARDSSIASAWEPRTRYHIACSYDGKRVQWYVNGLPLGPPSNFDFNFLTSDDNPPIAIGKHATNFPVGLSFNGILDEIRIYGTAQSADWVKAAYQSQLPGGSMVTIVP